MKTLTLTIALLIYTLSAFSQNEETFLGKTEKSIVTMMADDDGWEFGKKSKTNDSVTYITFKPLKSTQSSLKAFYFDGTVCTMVADAYTNKQLSKVVKALNSDKSLVSTDSYIWGSVDKNLMIEIEIKPNSEVFLVRYTPLNKK